MLKKMFLLVGIFLAMLVLFLAYFFIKNSMEFSSNDFKISGIGLNDTKREIVARFGAPLIADDYLWKYPGLEFEFWADGKSKVADKVVNIKVMDPKYQTIRGIRIGDSVAQVYKAYGEKGNFDPGEYKNIKFYNPVITYYKPILRFDYPAFCYYIFFKIEDGKVVQIDCSIETD